MVLIQPIGDLKTIDIKSDNHKLWSIFHIDKILVWNDLSDRYHQFTGIDLRLGLAVLHLLFPDPIFVASVKTTYMVQINY